VSDYQKDPAITSILEKVDIFLLPVANPDGYVYTQTQVSNPKPPGVEQNLLVEFLAFQ
jgi:murein tripeptide amidase MpaA